jgi:hypothetical protein
MLHGIVCRPMMRSRLRRQYVPGRSLPTSGTAMRHVTSVLSAHTVHGVQSDTKLGHAASGSANIEFRQALQDVALWLTHLRSDIRVAPSQWKQWPARSVGRCKHACGTTHVTPADWQVTTWLKSCPQSWRLQT